MEKECEDLDVNTWKIVEKTASNAGYREGISDGRETNFQSGFDSGYKIGFETGFMLGSYKGALHLQEEKQDSNSLLDNTMTGNCQMCRITNIDNEEMSQLVSIQQSNYEESLEKLKNRFPQINIK